MVQKTAAWWYRPLGFVGLLASLWLTSGCGLNRFAANRIIAAPNLQQHRMFAAWDSVWTNLLAKVTTNQPVSVMIPVGPPEASLSIMEIVPREYHTKFVTTVTHRPDGGGSLALNWEPEPRDTFQPRGRPATIVVLHGYGMMKEAMAPWGFLLAQAGFRVLSIDLRGHGRSTGAQIGFGKYETADLSQALDQLKARGLCDEQVGLLGLSYGATLALNWAARDPRVRTVVAIAPYNQPEEAIRRFADMAGGRVPTRILRGGAAAAAAKLELNWKDWSGEAGLRQLQCPVLLIGGAKDPICQPADIEALQKAAGGETKTLVLPEANHYVVGVSFKELTEPITDWFRERL